MHVGEGGQAVRCDSRYRGRHDDGGIRMNYPLNNPGYGNPWPGPGYAAPRGLPPRPPSNGTALAAAIIGLLGGLAYAAFAINGYSAWRTYAATINDLNDGATTHIEPDKTVFLMAIAFALTSVFMLAGAGLLFARTHIGQILLIIGGVVGILTAFAPAVGLAGESDYVPEADLLILQLILSAAFAAGPATVLVLASLPATGRWINAAHLTR